jgi:RTX calcium-binding nonapeptide repeat (4 copies)
MTRLTASSIGFDMSSWDLSDIADGTVTYDSATKVDVDGSAYHYAILGTGLGSFDADGFPQSGTITAIDIEGPGHVATKITGISIDAATFMAYVDDNDTNGLESAIFADKTSFIGGAGDDVLIGFGGNDKINVTKGGDDTINGGAGNDTITFNAAFTAADQVDGGAGRDTVNLDGDYSAGVVFGADTMVNVELLKLGAGHSYNLTLNATTDTTGQSLEVYGYALGSANTLTLDAAAVTGSLRLLGGAGNDVLTGGSGANDINGEAGNDTIYAGIGTNEIVDGTGKNTFVFSNWNSEDKITGSGSDTLLFNGDFSGGATLDGAQLVGVDYLDFAAGHNYDITIDSSDRVRHFDGSLLGAGDSLHLDASAVRVGMVITGGAGNDVLLGGARNGDNVFDLTQGGNDTVTGGTGTNEFDFGNAFTAADTLIGNADGFNDIVLTGNYSSPLVLGPNTLTNITYFDYFDTGTIDVVTNDANLAAGQVMTVTLGPGGGNAGPITFDGSAETNGSFDFLPFCTSVFTITGGAGNDTITAPVSDFEAGSSLNGGGGYNTLILGGDGGFNPQTMTNFQELDVDINSTIIMVTPGESLTVKLAGNGSEFDGAGATNGTFDISGFGTAIGGAGDDTITMSAINNPDQDEIFQGGGGADHLTNDAVTGEFIYTAEYVYTQASDSTGVNYDTITNFATLTDEFKLWTRVLAVDTPVTSGALSTATFDTDLARDIGSSQLGVHEAVIFTPDSGTLAGDHFLVIDTNGTAGYQAGQDLVILLDNASSLNLTTSNFTS